MADPMLQGEYEEPEDNGFDEFDDDSFGGGEPEAEGEQPSPQAAPEVSDVAAALEAKIANLEQRLADTQRWGQQQNNSRTIAADLIAAQRESLRLQQQAEAERAQYAYPELSDEDREALIADPDVVLRVIRQTAEAARNQVWAAVSPRLQAAQAVEQLAEPMIEYIAQERLEKVRDSMVSDGAVSVEEFHELLPAAYQYLQHAAGNPIQFARLRMNPEALTTAVNMARQNLRGTRVNASPRGPSIGNGSPGARGGNQRRPATRSPEIAAMERNLGVKFTDAEIARLSGKQRR
jgi:hypothetical protein